MWRRSSARLLAHRLLRSEQGAPEHRELLAGDSTAAAGHLRSAALIPGWRMGQPAERAAGPQGGQHPRAPTPHGCHAQPGRQRAGICPVARDTARRARQEGVAAQGHSLCACSKVRMEVGTPTMSLSSPLFSSSPMRSTAKAAVEPVPRPTTMPLCMAQHGSTGHSREQASAPDRNMIPQRATDSPWRPASALQSAGGSPAGLHVAQQSPSGTEAWHGLAACLGGDAAAP